MYSIEGIDEKPAGRVLQLDNPIHSGEFLAPGSDHRGTGNRIRLGSGRLNGNLAGLAEVDRDFQVAECDLGLGKPRDGTCKRSTVECDGLLLGKTLDERQFAELDRRLANLEVAVLQATPHLARPEIGGQVKHPRLHLNWWRYRDNPGQVSPRGHPLRLEDPWAARRGAERDFNRRCRLDRADRDHRDGPVSLGIAIFESDGRGLEFDSRRGDKLRHDADRDREIDACPPEPALNDTDHLASLIQDRSPRIPRVECYIEHDLAQLAPHLRER